MIKHSYTEYNVDAIQNTTSAQKGKNRLTEATLYRIQRQRPSRHYTEYNVFRYLPYILLKVLTLEVLIKIRDRFYKRLET